MSNDESQSQSTNESIRVDDTEEEMTQEEAIRRLGKFVWDSNSMMPVVISTRAKAIAKSTIISAGQKTAMDKRCLQ